MKNKKAPAFTRKLISLVMPIAFQQFMLALVSASDALMLGVISQDSLSAVSLAGQITFIHNLLLEAMTIGLSLIAAQYWGKGDIPAVGGDLCLCDESYDCNLPDLYSVRAADPGNADEDLYQ